MHCDICGSPRNATTTQCQTCGHSFANPSQHLSPGALLADKYCIGSVLGQGGFGVTYAAVHQTLGIPFAIKELLWPGVVRLNGILHPPSNLSPQDWHKVQQDFIAEGQTLAQFQLPGVVRVVDVFQQNGTAYLVMEHLEGETLEDRLQRQQRLSTTAVIVLAREILETLKTIHTKGILHRDIKPSNIFMGLDNQSCRNTR